MSAAAPGGRRWLFGPVPDLLFGCGLLYAGVFVAQTLASAGMQTLLPFALFPFVTLLIGAPHYGATLLRVVEDRPGQARYLRFTVVLTVLCVLALAVGLRHVVFGSLVLTIFLTWSPWHYSGQNYGVGLVFLRRRGVPVPPLAQRLLQGTFVTSFLLTALALHGEDPSGSYTPTSYKGTAFQLLPLGLSRDWVEPLFLATTVAFALCTVAAFALLLRRARPADLVPTAMVWLTQTLWFFAPAVARHWSLLPGIDPLAPDQAAYTLMWIAIGHFLQYLWFTSYFAVPRAPLAGKLRYWGSALAAGAALWVLPTLVFAPGVLGAIPYDVGLAVMGAAIVNLHHFVLDGLIWKTASGGRLRRLLADPPGAPSTAGAPWRRLAPLVWVAGALCAAIYFTGYWESEVGVRRALARGDLGRYRQALERSAWIGRESPRHHVGLAQLALDRGDSAAARIELERSFALYPTAAAWTTMGQWHEKQSQWSEALAAYEQAAALDPTETTALYNAAQIWLRLDEPARARDALLRIVELVPDDRRTRLSLARAEAALRRAGEEPPPAARATAAARTD